MIVECLHCGNNVESDDFQQYCNDYCEEKSDMELLDKILDEIPDARCQGNGCGEMSEGIKPITYHQWARTDHYGIYTGLYCDKCFKDNYPYRRDDYFDPAYAGERLEPED